MKELIKRYDWSDALVEAQTDGLIENGALLLAMKLAKAINWKPKDNRPAGLYWKNEEALEAVGASRATYFKHRKRLFELGFFIEVNGNLIPQVPDLSLVETFQSLLKTDQSLLETEKSLLDNPLSVDTCSEDALSVKNEVSTAASAPVLTQVISKVDSLNPSFAMRYGVPLALDSLLAYAAKSQRQSLLKTEDKHERLRRQAREAEERRRTALADMGIDLEGVW